MIRILEEGKEQRRVFKFVCRQCGCVYIATEDEAAALADEKETLYTRCPMAYCNTMNKSAIILNNHQKNAIYNANGKLIDLI